MKLILTMAGKYSRFVNAGFKTPKYLLPWGSRSILSEILHTLLDTKNFDDVYLIANPNDNFYLNHVRVIMKEYGINSNNLIFDSNPQGQASSAYIGISKIADFNDPIVIHNIDTLLYNRDIQFINNSLKLYNGYIDVFNSNNHEYSYVLSNSDNLVTMICEKVLVSNVATSGMYGFSSSRLYLENYCGEEYISQIYSKMISVGEKICIGKIHDESNTIVLGTPASYEAQSKLLSS
jgi:dTDP-glucose pyrophosphorylase